MALAAGADPAHAAVVRPANKAWWYAGMVLDIVHMPLVIGMVVLGAAVWSGPVYAGIVTTVVVLQVALLGCPMMLLTGWMKRKYDPAYEVQWSFTAWLYRRYGRWFGVAVFGFFMAVALLVRWALF